MKTETKIYKIKDFVRTNVSGDLDPDKSMDLVRQLSGIAFLHSGHNILFDMRDTTVSNVSILDLMELTLNIVGYVPDFKNKIASVIPVNEKRLRIARQFKACMALKDYSYEVFTDFEKAIEWLSDSS